ncbi:MAG: hypothetical protein GY811_30925 [Myxococcales bacterium]|nr:hypothetical protein [Myxococcales bacterium]
MTKVYFVQLPNPLDEGNLARVTIGVGPEEDRVESSVLMWLGLEGSIEPPVPDAGL